MFNALVVALLACIAAELGILVKLFSEPIDIQEEQIPDKFTAKLDKIMNSIDSNSLSITDLRQKVDGIAERSGKQKRKKKDTNEGNDNV